LEESTVSTKSAGEPLPDADHHSRICARSNSATAPHDRQHQHGRGRVAAAEGQVLLAELDADAAGGQPLDEAPQVHDVAGQAVHAVDHHRVALPDVGEHLGELRALGVLAGGLVGEDAVERHLVELANPVLVQGADPDVPDALTVHSLPIP
jgi:hypothetical protein